MSLTGKVEAERKLRGKINKLDVIYTDTYEIAVKNGYKGTVEEWLASLPGKSAYQYAKEAGFTGTEEEFASWLAYIDLNPYAKKNEIPKALSEMTEDETHRTVTDAEKQEWSAKSNFSGNYEDLENKPAIPTALPNPKSITFTGATTGTYNGSSAMTVNIPRPAQTLRGTTDQVSPIDVAQALDQGIPVSVRWNDYEYGGLIFNSFVYGDELGAVYGHAIVDVKDGIHAYVLTGLTKSNTWSCRKVAL